MQQEALRGKFKPFDASHCRVGIVLSEFNRPITRALLQSCRKKLVQYRVPKKNITLCRVAGSVEIPVVLRALADTKTYDCLVALGAVIKGETDHYHYVIKIACEGILEVMAGGLPVGFGILTCGNLEQARARLGVGGWAAEAALQAARVIKAIKERDSA